MPIVVPMRAKERIESKLKAVFQPEHLEVVNESSNHNVPPGSETHFKVVLVAKVFTGKSLIQRHRWVYELLDEEMKSGVHALALQTQTPEEWIAYQSDRRSPPCLGGEKENRKK
jgi:stress-induced morphogen